jgi:hypothetical protein
MEMTKIKKLEEEVAKLREEIHLLQKQLLELALRQPQPFVMPSAPYVYPSPTIPSIPYQPYMPVITCGKSTTPAFLSGMRQGDIQRGEWTTTASSGIPVSSMEKQ